MTAMADAGGGAAHFAETPDAAPAIFAQELEGLTQVVAQNVSLEIRPHAAVEVLGVLNEYPQVAVAGGVQVELGDAFAGERRRVVLALHVPHLAALGPVTRRGARPALRRDRRRDRAARGHDPGRRERRLGRGGRDARCPTPRCARRS